MTDMQPAGRVSRKLGYAPGTLVHIGRQRDDRVAVEAFQYGADHVERTIVDDAGTLAAMAGHSGVLWVDVNGIHDTAVVAEVGRQFDLHPLLLEDVVNSHQRPKVEEHGPHLFLVLKMLQIAEDSRDIEAEQVSIVLGPNYVLTFQERERDTFESVRRRLQDAQTRVRQRGADFLAYALVDTIVDNYFTVLESLGDAIEALEDDVMEAPDRETLSYIYDVKRVLAELRRALWPLRDAMAFMGRGDSPLVQAGTLPYLRDVQDHVIRVLETIETYRDTVSTLLDMYMSSVSNRLNDVMRVLTVIATLFIPLTFIVGVYGMNFPHMPEFGWPWGYAAVWGVMIAVAVALLAFFRRRGWL